MLSLSTQVLTQQQSNKNLLLLADFCANNAGQAVDQLLFFALFPETRAIYSINIRINRLLNLLLFISPNVANILNLYSG